MSGNEPISPGAALSEMLEKTGMSRKELSQRAGVTEKHISTVINGERGISTSFARKLGYVFAAEEADTSHWLRVQADYDAWQAQLKAESGITDEELAILKPLHEITGYFIKRGWMHNACGDAEKVVQLRSLLGVSDLTLIPHITYNAAYRAQLKGNITVDSCVLFAWQRMCEKETEKIVGSDVAPDVDRLESSVPSIRNLMSAGFRDVVEGLQRILGECGIAFAVVRNFRGAPVQGFIKQTPGKSLVMCLTNRGKRADSFWFTLFHEIGHVLHGDYSMRFVDFDSVEDAAERKADLFAQDTLIGRQAYHDFIRTPDCVMWSGIEAFAAREKVPAWIVLGRLQKDRIIDWSQYANQIPRYDLDALGDVDSKESRVEGGA